MLECSLLSRLPLYTNKEDASKIAACKMARTAVNASALGGPFKEYTYLQIGNALHASCKLSLATDMLKDLDKISGSGHCTAEYAAMLTTHRIAGP